jgi:4-amino-4-deoxychorismate lyase
VESALRAGADQPGLTLIETLGWTGVDFPRLHLHMDRLARSARALGWAIDGAAAQAALHNAAPDGPARMRLTLEAAGVVLVTSSPMPPGKPGWTVSLAKTRLNSADPWLRVKSTNRATYDATRANLPEGVDEAIFQNELGEVCDGTITTLFFDRGQGMRTPPLTCGLLPGVLRAELNVPEETLLATDLPQMRLWVGNSLRGLIPATWVG